VADNREIARAGVLEQPAQHDVPCSCLRRRTEQSGEVRSGATAQRAPSAALAPATPLTGFMPRPNYTPPKVIVSQLLTDETPLEVMLFEGAPYESLVVRDLPVVKGEIDLAAMEDFGFGD
jgi:hypothetical protein